MWLNLDSVLYIPIFRLWVNFNFLLRACQGSQILKLLIKLQPEKCCKHIFNICYSNIIPQVLCKRSYCSSICSGSYLDIWCHAHIIWDHPHSVSLYLRQCVPGDVHFHIPLCSIQKGKVHTNLQFPDEGTRRCVVTLTLWECPCISRSLKHVWKCKFHWPKERSGDVA